MKLQLLQNVQTLTGRQEVLTSLALNSRLWQVTLWVMVETCPNMGGIYYLLLQGEVSHTVLSEYRRLALKSIHHEEIATWYNELIRIYYTLCVYGTHPNE